MLAFRFANGMFEPLWNRNYIDNVQITAAEDIGDRLARRLLRHRRRAARPGPEPHAPAADAAVHGAAGVLLGRRGARREGQGPARHPPARGRRGAADGGARPVHGRHAAAGRPSTATWRRTTCPRTRTPRPTPRCAWRWTTGAGRACRSTCAPASALARKVTEIAVTLKPVPHLAFQQEGSVGVKPNQIVLTMQPNEGVSISLGAKIPGTRMRIRPVNMEFLYGTAFLSESPEAYERLIMDAMRGDATLFTRDDEVEAQWRICDPILEAWAQSEDGGPPQYEAGSQGPERGRRAADRRPALASRSDGECGGGAERRRLVRAGHHARPDRGGAARAAQGAPRRERRPTRPRAC